jgi:hypothetical protein
LDAGFLTEEKLLEGELLKRFWLKGNCWRENAEGRIAEGKGIAKEAKERTWDSANLMGQSKSEYQGFKKARERTWDSASLKAKTLREIVLRKAKRNHGTGQV